MIKASQKNDLNKGKRQARESENTKMRDVFSPLSLRQSVQPHDASRLVLLVGFMHGCSHHLFEHLHLQWQPQALSTRSEEHTSELQSLMRISYAVFCLKKKNK